MFELGIRPFFARILVAMAAVFVVANLTVVSVNYESRQAFWTLAEAQQQATRWYEARESIIQLTSMEQSVPSDLSDMLASLPVPLGCCAVERKLVLDSLHLVGSREHADEYLSSAAWEQFLLSQRLHIEDARQALNADVAVRVWMVPVLSALALSMVLLLSWAILKRRIILPTERLSRYVSRLLRGRQSKGLNLADAPSELLELCEAFDLTIGDYRDELTSRRERTLEMSGESDLLERQVQSLVEMSERPAFIVDVNGTVRTWNRQMISLTGISRNQAIRTLFASDFLEPQSQEIYALAMQTARSGKLPDEFGCVLVLRGDRRLPVSLQLSPQVEPGLGVNRVLAIVGGDPFEGEVSVAASGQVHTDKLNESGVLHYIQALQAGFLALSANDSNPTADELHRRQRAMSAALAWLVGAQNEPANQTIDAGEVLAHMVSVLSPRCAELDIELETDLKHKIATIGLSAGAMIETLNALCDNAIDAIKVNGAGKRRIKLSTESSQNQLLIHVGDTGTGFVQGTPSKACEPFLTTKADRGGLGLGLTHVKFRAEMSGGALSFGTPLIGKGAIVTLSLPTVTDTL